MNDPERLLQRARKRGDLPVSASFLRAAGLLAFALYAPGWLSDAGDDARRGLTETLRRILLASEAPDPTALLLDVPFGALTEAVVRPVLALSALVIGAVLIAGFAQTRGATVVREKAGVEAASFARTGVALLLGVSLLAACAGVLLGHLTLWSTPTAFSSSRGARPFFDLFEKLALSGATVALILGALDLWRVRIRWRQRNELTAAELRREQRQRGVAPEIRAVQRGFHREMAEEGRDPAQ